MDSLRTNLEYETRRKERETNWRHVSYERGEGPHGATMPNYTDTHT